MKKIINLFIILLIPLILKSQTLPTGFNLVKSKADGKYYTIKDNNNIVGNLNLDLSLIDTNFTFVKNKADGLFSTVTNKHVFNGASPSTISAQLIYLLNNNLSQTDKENHFTATQYFNRLVADTITVNHIDSVKSTYWYSNTGDTIGYIDAGTEKVAFFKQMDIGTLQTKTTVAENFIRSNQVQTDTIYPHSPLMLMGDTTFAKKLFADTVRAKGIEIGTIRQGRNIIQEGIALMYIHNLVIRDSITGYNRLFLTRSGELSLASSGRFCLTDYNNAQGRPYSSIGSTGNNNMTFYGEGLVGSNVIFSYNNTAVTFNTPIALNGINTPSNPTAGMIYYNSSDNHFYGYNGTIWKQLDN